jgi:Flp pilus assembly protein TadD
MRQQDTAAAAAVLDKALQRWPGNPSMLNNLGMCHLMTHDYDGAAKAFAQAHEAQPAEVACQTNLAVALGMCGGDAQRADDEFALAKSTSTKAPAPVTP